MNRFHFLGAQTDEAGKEWCYILDTQNGQTFKSPVKTFGTGGGGDGAGGGGVDTGGGAGGAGAKIAAPSAVKDTEEVVVDQKPPAHPQFGTLTMETADERKIRLGRNKVPPAFLGDTSKMYKDPSKEATQ